MSGRSEDTFNLIMELRREAKILRSGRVKGKSQLSIPRYGNQSFYNSSQLPATPAPSTPATPAPDVVSPAYA